MPVQSAEKDPFIDSGSSKENYSETENWENNDDISGSSRISNESKRLTFNYTGILVGEPSEKNYIHKFIQKSDIEDSINSTLVSIGLKENTTSNTKTVADVAKSNTEEIASNVQSKVSIETFNKEILGQDAGGNPLTDGTIGIKSRVDTLENLDFVKDPAYSKTSADSTFLKIANSPVALNNGVPGFTQAEYDAVDEATKTTDNKLYFIFE